jgi:hypothetical protein
MRDKEQNRLMEGRLKERQKEWIKKRKRNLGFKKKGRTEL